MNIHVDPAKSGADSATRDSTTSVAEATTTSPDATRVVGKRLTKQDIVDQCRKHNGYAYSPELNHALYLHYLNLTHIGDDLKPYVSCRVLWLNHNNIESVAGLTCLAELRNLYLQHNRITDLQPWYPKRTMCAPDSPPQLMFQHITLLDISYNSLRSFQGIEQLATLETLLASHNHIRDILPIRSLTQLISFDVSFNELLSLDVTTDVLRQLPQLASCALHGNKALKMNQMTYRRGLINDIPTLKHLDEYPVFSEERRRAAAFMAGGPSGEREEREAMKQEENEQRSVQRQFFEEERRTRINSPGNSTTAATLQTIADDKDIYIPTA